MCQYVWAQFQHQQGVRSSRTESQKLVGLVWLAAQEVAASRNNDTYQEYAGAALARMVSVERSTWLRVYAAHWAAFKALSWKWTAWRYVKAWRGTKSMKK
jgi:hypothetical protein